MNRFIAKHREEIKGCVSCFDRVLFKGYLPIGNPLSMEGFLTSQGVLLKDFKAFVTECSAELKAHAMAVAKKHRRPFEYLRSPIRKDEAARTIAQRDAITHGLVCVFSILEQAQSFKLRYGDGKPRLVAASPRCLCLYFYFLDRHFGLMHVRLQTWFPFVIQIYLNGHHWLARKLSRYGVGYEQIDNAFVSLDDPDRAQRFADRFTDINWPRVLTAFARRVNPLLSTLLSTMTYYWVIEQAEYATDLIFRDPVTLHRLYSPLLTHATVCFSAEDVMTFLGRKLHGRFQGDVRNEFTTRWPGARIKHRMNGNWIKMYNKHGCVLRVETVINRPHEFRIRRQGVRHGARITGWFPMAKRVSNLYRYAEISHTANQHYIEALAGVENPAAAYQLLDRITEPVTQRGRHYRPLNPLARRDLLLVQATLRGEHFIHGFQSADIARNLHLASPRELVKRRRQTARLNRLLRLLRAHGLIAKIPHTRRYRPTLRGVTFFAAIIHLRTEGFPAAMAEAA